VKALLSIKEKAESFGASVVRNDFSIYRLTAFWHLLAKEEAPAMRVCANPAFLSLSLSIYKPMAADASLRP
jgi:hypothetical protein